MTVSGTGTRPDRRAEQRVRLVTMADPATAPMVAELADEYRRRYGAEAAAREMAGHPDAEFAPPHGGVVLLEEDGAPVAGGAFRRADTPGAAEFKRVWTAGAHRRRGLGRRVMAELEAAAARAGYARVLLTTGPAQPEAVALYEALGYALDPAQGVDPSGARAYYAFTKDLPA
jgi:GNAT superfamily N-acetyltransferase